MAGQAAVVAGQVAVVVRQAAAVGQAAVVAACLLLRYGQRRLHAAPALLPGICHHGLGPSCWRRPSEAWSSSSAR